MVDKAKKKDAWPEGKAPSFGLWLISGIKFKDTNGLALNHNQRIIVVKTNLVKTAATTASKTIFQYFLKLTNKKIAKTIIKTYPK